MKVTDVDEHLENGVHLLCDQRAYEKAEREFSLALAVDPTCVPAFIYRHFCYVEQKAWNKALSDLNQAIRLCPDDHRLYSYRATVYTSTRQYEPAHEEICTAMRLYFPYLVEQAVRLHNANIAESKDEGTPVQTSNLTDAERPQPEQEQGTKSSIDERADHSGVIDCSVSDDEEGLPEDLLIPCDDRMLYYIWRKGWLALELRWHKRAVADYTTVIEQTPEDACAFNNRGIGLMRLGLFNDALDDFNKAIELNPDHPDHINSRAELHRRMGNMERSKADSLLALETCDRVFDPELGDDVVWKDRAEALINLERFAEALETVKALLAMGEDTPEVHRIAAEAHAGLGNKEQSLDFFHKSIEVDANPDVLLKRAELLENMGQQEQAARDRARAEELLRTDLDDA